MKIPALPLAVLCALNLTWSNAQDASDAIPPDAAPAQDSAPASDPGVPAPPVSNPEPAPPVPDPDPVPAPPMREPAAESDSAPFVPAPPVPDPDPVPAPPMREPAAESDSAPFVPATTVPDNRSNQGQTNMPSQNSTAAPGSDNPAGDSPFNPNDNPDPAPPAGTTFGGGMRNNLGTQLQGNLNDPSANPNPLAGATGTMPTQPDGTSGTPPLPDPNAPTSAPTGGNSMLNSLSGGLVPANPDGAPANPDGNQAGTGLPGSMPSSTSGQPLVPAGTDPSAPPAGNAGGNSMLNSLSGGLVPLDPNGNPATPGSATGNPGIPGSMSPPPGSDPSSLPPGDPGVVNNPAAPGTTVRPGTMSGAPGSDATSLPPTTPGATDAPTPPEVAREKAAPPTQETVKLLEAPAPRDENADRRAAQTIKDDNDAKKLIFAILGGAAAGAIAANVVNNNNNNGRQGDPRFRPNDHDQGHYPPRRISERESGRSQRDRDQSVNYMRGQFSGQRPPGAGNSPAYGRGNPAYPPVGAGNRPAYGAGNSPANGSGSRPPSGGQVSPGSYPPITPGAYPPAAPQGYPNLPPPTRSAPGYYEGNRRMVRYSSNTEIPPIIVASSYMNRVEILPAYQMNYKPITQAPAWAATTERPPAYYQNQNAYAVSYKVDPNSLVSRDDILFRQGSTAFTDAYSYDVVIDLVEAMNHQSLFNYAFIIEGHASAEGSYASNLRLSQLRAERIAQELVRYGVAPERLLPVGYGESEANYPAEAPEQYRRYDRRVLIFRME